MPAQTLDACLRALAKSEPAPAYYFYGPEDLLKDEALRAILDRSLDPSLRDFNLDQRSAGQLDADTLFGALHQSADDGRAAGGGAAGGGGAQAEAEGARRTCWTTSAGRRPTRCWC